MTFKIPSMKIIHVAANNLSSDYERKRKLKNLRIESQCFLSFNNAVSIDRLNEIHFIQMISNYVLQYKAIYHRIDPHFCNQPNKDGKFLTEFHKHAIAGSFLLILSKISNGYWYESSVKNTSALGEILLNLFNINKLSEAPKKERIACFKALKQYMQVMDGYLPEHPHDDNWRVFIEEELLRLTGFHGNNRKQPPSFSHFAP